MQIQNPCTWRQILRKNITSIDQLAVFLKLTKEQKKHLLQRTHFPINIPLRLAQKIEKNTLNDPLFRQFVPIKEEEKKHPGYVQDPVEDKSFQKTENLLCKYEGRGLIVTTGACAMHCRYCFRQNFDYTPKNGFEDTLEQIAKDSSLEEVILSGGDPLSLSNKVLKDLLQSISNIPHIQRIRFHSRFPMGIPERINGNFLKILKNTNKTIWFVLHANHPNEFDADIWDHLSKIQRLGIPILHQAVLLKGVNDNVETLAKLYTELINHAITPYYLHQLDPVQGSGHFFVPKEQGAFLIEELTKRLSGFAVPRYVEELPGNASKTAITNDLHLI